MNIPSFSKRASTGCLLICAVVSSVFVCSALGQVNGTIGGRVKDETSAAIPGVTITVRSLETSETRSVLTGDSGDYRVLALRAGDYEVRAEFLGFRTAVKPDVKLTVGGEVVVDFTMQVGEISEAVQVLETAPLVNTTTADVSGLVGEREIKELPLNGRSFDNLITLNPGTVNMTSKNSIAAGNSFTVSGRRFSSNIFLLNGIELTAGGSSSSTPGSVSGQLLGIDAIREFDVVKDDYSAELGKRSGAQVNVVVMSGTNNFHGSLFEFHRNSALDARNFFDREEVPAFKRNNFGLSVGGPVIRDETFFFSNYEGFRERLGLSSVAIVPDENARQGLITDSTGRLVSVGLAPGVAPYFKLWPLPNGENFKDGRAVSFSNPKEVTNEYFWTVRIDHRLSEQDALNSVYTIDSGNQIAPNEDPLNIGTTYQRAQVYSLEETHTFSAHLLNTARFGISRGTINSDNVPQGVFPPEMSFVAGRPIGNIRIGGGAGSGSTAISQTGSAANDRRNSRTLFTISDKVQIIRGSHLINIGFWGQRIHSNQVTARSAYGEFVFTNLTSFLQGRASNLTAVPDPAEMGFRSTEVAWFIEDAVKLRQNLNLSLGLRHEMTDGWNDKLGRISNFVFNSNGILVTAPRVSTSAFVKNNAKKLFSPRIGVAWDPSGRGTTSVHLGFGIFHDLMDELGFNLTSNPPFNTTLTLRNLTFPLQLARNAPVPPLAQVAPSGIQPDAKIQTVVSYRLKVEQQVGPNMSVTAAYVGARSYNLLTSSDVNTTVGSVLTDGRYFFPAGAPRLNPQLGSSRYWLTNGDSYYNGLELELKRRLSQGLSFRTGFTFSKSIDNSSQTQSLNGIGTPQQLLYWKDTTLDRGVSTFDVRKRFTFSAVYELPFGKGRSLLSNVAGAADKLLSGWQVNTIVNLSDGFPFTPQLGFNQSRNGDSRAPDRPDLRPGRTPENITLGGPDRYFDAAAFSLPLAGTFGNAGRNMLVAPGVQTVDLALFKSTRISETFSVQFRAEGFNLFNRANFGIPSPNVLNTDGTVQPLAGRVTSATTSSRQIQLGLKIIF